MLELKKKIIYREEHADRIVYTCEAGFTENEVDSLTGLYFEYGIRNGKVVRRHEVGNMSKSAGLRGEEPVTMIIDRGIQIVGKPLQFHCEWMGDYTVYNRTVKK